MEKGASTPPPREPNQRAYARVRLLAIGIDQYPHTTELPDLRGAHNDAQHVVDLFKRLFPGNDDTILDPLLGPDATYERVRTELSKWPAKANPEDLLAVFFSGHGLRRVTNGLTGAMESGVCLVEYENRSGWKGFVKASELWGWLAESRARHKLLIFDCCYPALGLLARGMPDDQESWKPLWERTAAQVLAAASFEQASFETAQTETMVRGIFTTKLIEGLQGPLFDGLGQDWVTLEQLGVWLRKKVSEEVAKVRPAVRQEVQYGYVRDHSDDSGQVLFFRPSPALPLSTPAKQLAGSSPMVPAAPVVPPPPATPPPVQQQTGQGRTSQGVARGPPVEQKKWRSLAGVKDTNILNNHAHEVRFMAHKVTPFDPEKWVVRAPNDSDTVARVGPFSLTIECPQCSTWWRGDIMSGEKFWVRGLTGWEQ